MAESSQIEWTDATWNPITGCALASEGCRHCYAARLAATRMKNHPSRAGLARMNAAGEAKFTGEVRFNEQWLDQPLRWTRPRNIFPCAHADLFYEVVPDEVIDKVFAVMALTPHHTYQVLTKRPERMREWFRDERTFGRVLRRMIDLREAGGWPTIKERCEMHGLPWTKPESRDDWWPLRNVWLGVSVEDQATADARIPPLLDTPAAIRWVSAEPLLGPVDLEPWLEWKADELPNGDTWGCPGCEDSWSGGGGCKCPKIKAVYDVDEGPRGADGCPEWITYDRRTLDWVVVGGESGAKARPMHPDWARTLRDQCVAAGTPFFFKQWGEWAPGENAGPSGRTETGATWFNKKWLFERVTPKQSQEMHRDDEPDVWKVGKKRSGRLLDGVLHDAKPGGQQA